MQPNKQLNRFWSFFWLSLLLFFAIYLYAELRVEKLRMDAQGRLSLAPYLSPRWDQVIGELLEQQHLRLDGITRTEIAARIETEIDGAFSPVYAQIPKLADVHYSLLGEYAELSAAAFGRLQDRIGEILFQEVDFQGRLREAMQRIFTRSQAQIDQVLAQLSQQIGARMNFDGAEIHLLDRALQISLTELETRFENFSLELRGAGAAGGAVAGALVVKAMAKKLGGKLAGKAAIKVGVKAASLGGGAALGAAAGSFVPGLGTALGGILGAVLVWVATDKAVIEIDEYWNREAFEREIRTLLDEEKRRIKEKLQQAYGRYLSQIDAETRSSLEKVRPLDFMEAP